MTDKRATPNSIPFYSWSGIGNFGCGICGQKPLPNYSYNMGGKMGEGWVAVATMLDTHWRTEHPKELILLMLDAAPFHAIAPDGTTYLQSPSQLKAARTMFYGVVEERKRKEAKHRAS